jgi:hypothetical protein
MPLLLLEQDVLPHLSAADSLQARAVISQACLTVFSKFGISIELCYDIQGSQVEIEAKLSAFGQSISLGEATLHIGQSTTLNGTIDDVAKAEISVSINSNPLQICFNATGCVNVPFVGWKCASTGQHCVNI